MDLAGTHYYNPAWGWQNGKKRNANTAKSHQPVIILNHEYRNNNNTTGYRCRILCLVKELLLL
jgi:hypothetical protein